MRHPEVLDMHADAVRPGHPRTITMTIDAGSYGPCEVFETVSVVVTERDGAEAE